jgi:hypothetical protein
MKRILARATLVLLVIGLILTFWAFWWEPRRLDAPRVARALTSDVRHVHGTSIIPVRFRVPPDVVFLTISRQDVHPIAPRPGAR